MHLVPDMSNIPQCTKALAMVSRSMHRVPVVLEQHPTVYKGDT